MADSHKNELKYVSEFDKNLVINDKNKITAEMSLEV
jgi:hypothetical protein